jgi:hypothetical protein
VKTLLKHSFEILKKGEKGLWKNRGKGEISIGGASSSIPWAQGGDFCSAQVLQGCFDKPVRQAQVKEFK